jgi:hypothetical protein
VLVNGRSQWPLYRTVIRYHLLNIVSNKFENTPINNNRSRYWRNSFGKKRYAFTYRRNWRQQLKVTRNLK